MPTVILWTGSRHCGKTTRALDLVKASQKEGFDIAGLLALSSYCNGQLTGFDAYDIQRGSKKRLSEVNSDIEGKRRFTFCPDGLEFGRNALSMPSTKYADLIIVDEFGPFELDGQLWRDAVDSLLPCARGVILLVVRQNLIEDVCNLYADVSFEIITALESSSIEKVINILRNHTFR